MERHAQTVIGAIIIGLIIWVGSTVTENQRQITSMTVKMAFLLEKVKTLEIQLSAAAEDRYRAKEAVLAHDHLSDAIGELSDRVKVIENGTP